MGAHRPDREGRVAELSVYSGDKLDIPAEVYREANQTLITLFSVNVGPGHEDRIRATVRDPAGVQARTSSRGERSC